MPKPKYIVSPIELDLLLQELYLKTGIIIQTKRDCKKISELISDSDNFISESTIYRLFVLKNKSYTPYMHTLDVLSVFCGHKNWADWNKNNNFTRNCLFPYSEGIFDLGFDSIVNNCIKLSDYKVLRNYLMQFPYEMASNNCHILGNDVFKSLLHNPKSCLTFYNSFGDVPIIRKSFFELLADPDFELAHYDIALKQYLKGTIKDSSSKQIQDTVFALSLLSRHYFLNEKKDSFEKYAKLLYELEKDVIVERKNIYTFPKARFFIYKILYYKAFKSEIEQRNYEKWLLEFISEEKHSFNFQDSKIWIHTILDIRPFILKYAEFENMVYSIISLFKNMYPDNISDESKGLNIVELFDFTNQNSSAHWKKIWKN